MSVRSVGWTLSLGIAVAGAGFAAATALSSDETRRRAADSARLLRGRLLDSAAHVRDQAVQTASDLRVQWTTTAVDVRDRWTESAEEFRARAVDTAEDWRERSTYGLDRRLREAAEARDDSLAPLGDDED